MTIISVANITDALGGFSWEFDVSNFLVGPVGTGVDVGAPANPDQPNSVNVEGALYVSGVSADATFAPLASPTFTGTATFATLSVATANVTTCQSTHYELNGVDIKAGRALTQATGLIPGGFTPIPGTSNQFAGLNQTITPALSGLIYVLINGNMNFPVGDINQGGILQVYFGTGTPPTQGQTLANTSNYQKFWQQDCFIAPSSPAQTGFFTGSPFFQGTSGTTYWVDIQGAPFNSDPPTIFNVSIFLVEI